MSLAEELEPLSYDAAFTLVDIDDPGVPLDEMGDMALELEAKMSGIGIVLLLTDADTDTFLHNLMRAALVWKMFLERCHAEKGGKEDHNFCSGVFAPFLDAAAARDWKVATTLATLAPADFRDGHEHESDHAYARALFAIHGGTTDEAVLAPLFDQCADRGDRMSRARVEVLKAMIARDQAAFDDAFAALVKVREQCIQADVDRGQQATPELVAHREVFVEGIALLNLAERVPLDTSAVHPMCPALARLPMSRAFPGLR